jgi:uncharacterized RDD family membrane protein YckC/DNA-directed RNA polymerase subunit RPC12/RpoP
MSCVTIQKFEYRCTRCFHSLYAAVEEAGSEKPCKYCGNQIVLPEATPDRIARAENVPDEAIKVSSVPLMYADDNRTEAELRREVKRQMYVPPGEMQYSAHAASSRIMRLLGWVIDSVLLTIAFVGGVMLVLALVSAGIIDKKGLDSKELTLDSINALGVMYFVPLALSLIQWNMIAVHGQSIGKKLLGMRIVTATGHSPGFIHGVVLRNWGRLLMGMIPLLGFIDIAMIFGESRRCLHDYIAGTYVVDAH